MLKRSGPHLMPIISYKPRECHSCVDSIINDADYYKSNVRVMLTVMLYCNCNYFLIEICWFVMQVKILYQIFNHLYLCQGGYVFAWVCFWVCEFLSLFVNKITQKLMDGF